MPKRAITGYMQFMTERRQAVADELRAGEEKAGVPAVSRILGKMWKELPEDQKQVYKDRAAKLQAELAENDDGNDQQTRGEDNGPPPTLPVSAIKKIMISDEEVKRVSAECIHVMTKAAELIVAYLVVGAFEEAKKDKRKLIKLQDIENAVLLEPRLKASNTAVHIRQVAEASKKRKAEGLEEEEGGSQAKAPSSKKGKKDVKDPGQKKTITSFLQSK